MNDEETPTPPPVRRSPADFNDNQARRAEIVKRIKKDPTQFIDTLLEMEKQIDELWATISLIVPTEENPEDPE